MLDEERNVLTYIVWMLETLLVAKADRPENVNSIKQALNTAKEKLGVTLYENKNSY